MECPETVCRLCAQLTKDGYHIFDENRNLEAKIKKCLNITVLKDDYKPKQICETCFNKLNELSEFVDLCEATDKKLECSFISATTTTTQDWQTNQESNNFVENQQKISVIVNFKPTGGEIFQCNNNNNDTSLVLYKPNEVQPPINDYNCHKENNNILIPLDNYNGSNSSSKESLIPIENNNYNVINEEIINIVQSTTIDYETLTPIPEDITFLTATNYDAKRYDNEYYTPNNSNNSVLQHSSNYIIADYCIENDYSYLTQTRTVLNLTESNTYNQQEPVINDTYKYNNSYVTPCSPCSCNEVIVDCSTKNNDQRTNIRNVEYISVDQIKELVATEQPTYYKKKKPLEPKLYVCPLENCKKTFVRQLTFNAHTSQHSGSATKSFRCNVCNKSFHLKSDLNTHQKTHNDNYKCKICSKTFQVPSKLERHIRTHTKQKPFVCKFQSCGKAFSDKRNLDSHKTSHSNIRNFKCSLCSKTYKTKSQLKEHTKTHSPNSPYKCNICNKSYKWKANLINHKKSHTGYSCSYCQQKYGTFIKWSKHRKGCRQKFY